MDSIIKIAIAGIGLVVITMGPVVVSKFLQAWDGWEKIEREDER